MTNVADNSSRLQELIRKLLDEEIDDAQVRGLGDLLRDDPAAMDAYLSYMSLDAELTWECGCGPLPLGEQRMQVETPAEIAGTRPGRGKRIAWFLCAAASLVIIFAIVVVAFQSDEEVRPVAVTNLTLDFMAGEIHVVAEGQRLQPEMGMRLLRNIGIATHGPTSLARFAYDDGSRVLLSGDTLIEFSGDEQKEIQMQRGTISATVVPQPQGRPMFVTTPQARLEVLGTEFSLDASQQKTDLQVVQGSVRLTRIADGHTVVVPQGRRVEAAEKTSELTVREVAPVPSSWEESFESGSPSSWQLGRFVDSGLPPGSRGALQAELDERAQVYGVTSPHPWMHGLFAAQAETHLHFKFKMSNPGWINVFFITRTRDPIDPTTSLYKFNELPSSSLDAGRWRTATIPLRDFERKTATGFRPGSPARGEVVFGISCSAPAPDRGLIIDRIWATPDGPGKIVIEDAD